MARSYPVARRATGLARGRIHYTDGMTARAWRLAPTLFALAAGFAFPARPDELLLRVIRPGEALVRVRFTPYWLARGGCVERSGRWTKVTARRPGFLRLTIRFSPERVVSRGRRCNSG